MQLEKLRKFGVDSKKIKSIAGGTNATGTNQSETTFLDQVLNPGCSDNKTVSDDDRGRTTGTCTTYKC